MRILFFNIHMIGFQGLRIMSCRSVTMKAQFRSQAFTFLQMILAGIPITSDTTIEMIEYDQIDCTSTESTAHDT